MLDLSSIFSFSRLPVRLNIVIWWKNLRKINQIFSGSLLTHHRLFLHFLSFIFVLLLFWSLKYSFILSLNVLSIVRLSFIFILIRLREFFLKKNYSSHIVKDFPSFLTVTWSSLFLLKPNFWRYFSMI
jgi:hypothetical protein